MADLSTNQFSVYQRKENSDLEKRRRGRERERERKRERGKELEKKMCKIVTILESDNNYIVTLFYPVRKERHSDSFTSRSRWLNKSKFRMFCLCKEESILMYNQRAVRKVAGISAK